MAVPATCHSHSQRMQPDACEVQARRLHSVHEAEEVIWLRVIESAYPCKPCPCSTLGQSCAGSGLDSRGQMRLHADAAKRQHMGRDWKYCPCHAGA